MPFCFLNGEILPQENAFVSVRDIGLMRGYGIYDGIAVHNGKALRLKDHLDRLRQSAAGLSIVIPYSDTDLEQAIAALIEKNGDKDMIIKVIVTGGETIHGLEFDATKPTFLILVEKFVIPSASAYERGAKLIAYEHQRFLPQFKTINYIAAVMVQAERKKKEAIDVLYVSNGSVLECATSNIFIVKDNIAITPACNVLHGITRKVIIELAEKEGIRVEQRTVSMDEMLNADEVFITSSFKAVVPIVEVDGQKIGEDVPGSVSSRLLQVYREYVAEVSA